MSDNPIYFGCPCQHLPRQGAEDPIFASILDHFKKTVCPVHQPLEAHTLKSSLKRFSKSGSVPNKIESEVLRTLAMRHVAFQEPNLGPWGLGDSKSPMFFFAI